jgi:hypothetical protein
MQGLLLLLDAVLVGGDGLSGVSGSRGGRNLRLVAGSSGEISRANYGGRLDGRADVLDGSDGEIGTLLGGHGLLLRGGGSARLLENRVGLVKGGGRGSGVLGGGRRGVALLNGSAGNLIGGLLADVSLVDDGLLGASDVLRSQVDVLGGCGAGSFHGLVGVLGGDFAELLGLLVGDLSGVVEVSVNELLVGDVDQRSEVDDAGGDEEQAPLGSDLYEEEANKSSEESLDIVSGLRTLIEEILYSQQW